MYMYMGFFMSLCLSILMHTCINSFTRTCVYYNTPTCTCTRFFLHVHLSVYPHPYNITCIIDTYSMYNICVYDYDYVTYRALEMGH